jgi:hypothetical protein
MVAMTTRAIGDRKPSPGTRNNVFRVARPAQTARIVITAPVIGKTIDDLE